MNRSQVEKRSVVIAGRKTSISLENPFFNGLKDLARQRKMTLAALITEIDAGRERSNLSSVLRVHVLEFYRSAQKAALRKDAA